MPTHPPSLGPDESRLSASHFGSRDENRDANGLPPNCPGNSLVPGVTERGQIGVNLMALDLGGEIIEIRSLHNYRFEASMGRFLDSDARFHSLSVARCPYWKKASQPRGVLRA